MTHFNYFRLPSVYQKPTGLKMLDLDLTSFIRKLLTFELVGI